MKCHSSAPQAAQICAPNAQALRHNPHSNEIPRAFLLVRFVAAAARADSSHKPSTFQPVAVAAKSTTFRDHILVSA
jgi:hypothetical protein